ncbi:MAG: hypothetical protein SGPRY_011716, partial [Prymnesium sp.]
MDEPRLTNDTTEKNKSKSNRSIVGKKGDSAEALVNKGGGDGTGIGGSTADGKDLPGFFIFANNIIHSDDVKVQPICRRADAEGKAGEDVVHLNVFKETYHQAKMLKLGAKIFRGTYKLTVADLLDVRSEPQ